MCLTRRKPVALAVRRLLTLAMRELLALTVRELLALTLMDLVNPLPVPVRELLPLRWVRVILLMSKGMMLACRSWTPQRVLTTGRESLRRSMH